jgi:SAM-dependent methyltransferase
MARVSVEEKERLCLTKGSKFVVRRPAHVIKISGARQHNLTFHCLESFDSCPKHILAKWALLFCGQTAVSRKQPSLKAKFTMESNSGSQRWLEVPFLYNLFQDAIGGNALRRRFIQGHVRAKTGDKVIDIGCGPAQILPWLPDVEYLGFDVNRAYIASAKRRHRGKGTFVLGDAKSLWDDSRFRNADIVIGLGILHHLGDGDAAHCIRFAHHALKHGGRFVCLDACWVANQGNLSRYVMSRDRGQNVRTEQAYRHLAAKVFKKVDSWVDTKPMRIPYVTVVLECQK